MSKLSDRIRKAGRVEPAPLGFGAAARIRSASMLIAVRGAAGKAADAANAGADIVIVEGDTGKLKDKNGAVVGVAAGAPDRKAAASLRESGIDFLVLDPAQALAEAMLDEKLGFVLELREAMDDTHLKLLGELSLDAIILAPPEAPITLARLLEFRRIAGFIRAPVLVEADAGIDSGTLQLLRESGTAGVVLPASAIDRIGELKQRIDDLPARGKRKDDEREPLVPQASSGHDHGDYDDDDDD